MNKLNYNFQLTKISKITKPIKKLNIIDVKYRFKNAFSEISEHSNKYIDNCFNLGLRLMKMNKALALINGPISKKHFLKNFWYYRICC